MSEYMLSHLSTLVANGTRTSSGFKKVHLNMCARALNEHFNMKLTRDNIKNHLRTWKRRLAKINSLKNLSATGWVEDSCTITMDHEHYIGHVQDHKADAEFLNKPITHYKEMVSIFGNSLAMGKYAKGSSDALGTEDAEVENDDVDGTPAVPSPPDDNGVSSSATRPTKKAKVVDNEEEGLTGAFKASAALFAKAIEKASSDDLSPYLLEKVESIPGFDDTHKAYYYAYLVENPRMGKDFPNLPLTY